MLSVKGKRFSSRENALFRKISVLTVRLIRVFLINSLVRRKLGLLNYDITKLTTPFTVRFSQRKSGGNRHFENAILEHIRHFFVVRSIEMFLIKFVPLVFIFQRDDVRILSKASCNNAKKYSQTVCFSQTVSWVPAFQFPFG